MCVRTQNHALKNAAPTKTLYNNKKTSEKNFCVVYNMLVEILFGKPMFLLPASSRSTYACPKNLKHPFRLDWDERIDVYIGDCDGEFPLDSFEDVAELKEWINRNWDWLAEGSWYLMSRGHFTKAKPMRKPSAKQLEKLRRKKGRPRNVRRQRNFEANICLLKFEMEDGKCIKIYERQAPRKRAPNKTPLYHLIRIIKENKKARQALEIYPEQY